MILNFEKKLKNRKKIGNIRELQIFHSFIDFSSNDYLGLARSSQLATCVLQEYNRHPDLSYRQGSTGSRLLTGNSVYAQDLEDKIAAFHGYEAGLLFSCGYMANIGLLSAIASQESVIFFDIGVHASTYDGICLSRAKAFPFRHNDLNHLEERLKNSSMQGDRFICVESVYSTDGSTVSLPQLCQIAKRYDAHIIVDEAHAVGIYGPKGQGLVAEYNLMDHIFAQVTTFGKALGSYGAIVLGNSTLKQALINFASSYIYTTALPFQVLAAIKCGYDLFPAMEGERLHLQKLIQIFREHYSSYSMTHIQPIPIKGNQAVKQVAQRLASLEIDVRPLMSPTVQRGHELIRICLHAFNTENELMLLLKHIRTQNLDHYA